MEGDILSRSLELNEKIKLKISEFPLFKEVEARVRDLQSLIELQRKVLAGENVCTKVRNIETVKKAAVVENLEAISNIEPIRDEAEFERFLFESVTNAEPTLESKTETLVEQLDLNPKGDSPNQSDEEMDEENDIYNKPIDFKSLFELNSKLDEEMDEYEDLFKKRKRRERKPKVKKKSRIEESNDIVVDQSNSGKGLILVETISDGHRLEKSKNKDPNRKEYVDRVLPETLKVVKLPVSEPISSGVQKQSNRNANVDSSNSLSQKNVKRTVPTKKSTSSNLLQKWANEAANEDEIFNNALKFIMNAPPLSPTKPTPAISSFFEIENRISGRRTSLPTESNGLAYRFSPTDTLNATFDARIGRYMVRNMNSNISITSVDAPLPKFKKISKEEAQRKLQSVKVQLDQKGEYQDEKIPPKSYSTQKRNSYPRGYDLSCTTEHAAHEDEVVVASGQLNSPKQDKPRSTSVQPSQSHSSDLTRFKCSSRPSSQHYPPPFRSKGNPSVSRHENRKTKEPSWDYFKKNEEREKDAVADEEIAFITDILNIDSGKIAKKEEALHLLQSYVKSKRLGFTNPAKRLFTKTLDFEYFHEEYECIYCGEQKRLTTDHVIPVSRKGKIKVKSCSTCNSSKADQSLIEWVESSRKSGRIKLAPTLYQFLLCTKNHQLLELAIADISKFATFEEKRDYFVKHCLPEWNDLLPKEELLF
ncbi:hypothetical protein HDV01_002241 [Terramyces sp. JEL0728]|nr:hypothetical protein HDV01_002241 [Terramyces sp. JEL0728]